MSIFEVFDSLAADCTVRDVGGTCWVSILIILHFCLNNSNILVFKQETIQHVWADVVLEEWT